MLEGLIVDGLCVELVIYVHDWGYDEFVMRYLECFEVFDLIPSYVVLGCVLWHSIVDVLSVLEVECCAYIVEGVVLFLEF